MASLKQVTLEDFEVRYKNIRMHAEVKKCTVRECPNPRDSTPHLGEDTCCAYHRLLFDFWSCNVAKDPLGYTQKGRRRSFTNWRNKLGVTECDKIVLRLAQEGINWEC